MLDFYVSGSLGEPTHRDRIWRASPHRLLSLHPRYLKLASEFLGKIDAVRDTCDMGIMFDSGAYTAWTRGEPEPDIGELARLYGRALKRCEGRFRDVWFISLDRIPGRPGVTPSEVEIAEAIRVSDENFKLLTAELGARVLPVFHQSESTERLREIVDLGVGYVCVSPRNDVKEVYRRAWSQRVHALIGDVATHGLATTGGGMLLDVAWRSVDSASWVQLASFGIVALPMRGAWEPVRVSNRNAYRRHWGWHVDNMGPQVAPLVAACAERYGVTLDELREYGGARELFNVQALVEIAAQPREAAAVPQTLFAL